MQSQDQEVLEQLAQWLDAGHQPYLSTIVKTSGSSPRPVGSMLACWGDLVIGTLSGAALRRTCCRSWPTTPLTPPRPN